MDEYEAQTISDILIEIITEYSRYVNASLDLRQYSLTKTQWKVLMITASAEKLSMGSLADRIGISPEQTSRTVSPLVKRGLLTRTPNPMNRRQIDIEMSPDGTELLRCLKKDFTVLLNHSVSKLSANERSSLTDSLRTAADIIKKALHSELPD